MWRIDHAVTRFYITEHCIFCSTTYYIDGTFPMSVLIVVPLQIQSSAGFELTFRVEKLCENILLVLVSLKGPQWLGLRAE